MHIKSKIKMYILQLLVWICLLFSSSNGILAGFKGDNVAYNKTAIQYKAFIDTNFTWTADLAVDGRISETPVADQCCSGSMPPEGSSDPNFWQVDLGDIYTVGLVIINGRTDLDDPKGRQMSGFIVYGQTSNSEGLDDNVIYNDTDKDYPADGEFEITVNPERSISFIRIERPTGFLSVCEVKVYEVCGNGSYGINCTQQCGRCRDNEPCNKTTGECDNGCQSGWTGDMCNNKENIAFNMTASQSTTLDNFTAMLAVDGCTNQTVDSMCCSRTQPSVDNEWSVNFGAPRTLAKIRVYGMLEKDDELANFTVWYGDMLRQVLYTNNGANYTNITDIDLTRPIETNKLTIRLTNSSNDLKSLTICEVEVFEICEPGYYGDDCKSTCGNCLNNETCYGSGGACPNGCQPGYGGDVCKTECYDGTYGSSCMNECGQCRNASTCDRVTGDCPTPDFCEPGYLGQRCDTECSNGSYGYNCNMTCGSCINNTQCNIINGTCISCDSGYYGDMCDQKCVSPSFGPDCSKTCNCLDNATCDFDTGHCPGDCDPGWHGQSCDTACQNFTYGINCAMNCSNCLNNEECDKINGTCSSGCDVGWINDTCDQSCEDGKFGDKCMEECGHCLDNKTCDFRTGHCPSGCMAGWTGDTCKTECSNGYYGTNCEGRCYCMNGVACNTTTGICPNGQCEVGFTGDYCHTDLNRAVNKTTNQSSVLVRDGFTWMSSLAVDGNFDQSNSSLTRTCSATDPNATDTTQWWYVDMETVSRMDYIVVYGKSEINTELEGFYLYLTNTSNITDIKPTYNSSGIAYDKGIYVINFTAMGESKLARYIYITLESTESLSLCEVRVLGECPVGTHGEQCEGICNCADNIACNEITGICPDGGCQPGWTGDQCNQGCKNGNYGIECSMICGSCDGNITCHQSTGICQNGCTDGWITDWCNVSCSEGTYGTDCNKTCGHCKNNDTCDHVTGVCPDGCTAGFEGNLCDTVCSNGTYGENCLSTCGNCVNDTICDIVTGRCEDGCKDGYVEPLCASSSTQTKDDSDENVGAILGGIFGGLAVIIIIAVVYKLCIQRKSASSMKPSTYHPSQTSSTFAASHNYGYQITEVSGSKQSYSFTSSTRL